MIVAVFIGMLGVPHLVEGIRGGDASLLRLEHLDVAIFSFVAAYAMWTDKRWAPWALAVAGAATAILVVSLGPLLKMDPVARSGLWTGAASIAVLTAIGVWYLTRRLSGGRRRISLPR
jgi:hypothetical protein